MEFQKQVTARLTEEDIKQAVAEYVSRSHGGDYTFDAENVELHFHVDEGQGNISANISNGY